MDKKSKFFTYIAIMMILTILVVIAIMTKFSNSAPGVTVYAENGATAEAILGGYTWNSFLKPSQGEAKNVLECNYLNENTLLVKPGEKLTLRNSGKNFDSYKFYQDYIKYYDSNGNLISIDETEAPINPESKFVSFFAPEEEGTFLFEVGLNYHRSGKAEYCFKVVVSHLPSYSVETLIKYKNSYMGDAVKVGHILNALPYKEYRDGIVLRTAKKPYELIVYYKGIDLDKDTLRNNTIALFALIDNVDIVSYELDNYSFVYTRKELETILGRDLLEYASNPELWMQEVFYHVKESINVDEMKVLKAVITEELSHISSDYIVIDLDSFESLSLTDTAKRELLKEFAQNGKMILEATNAEIRQRDSFKGVLIYASQVEKKEDGYDISIVEYYSANKQEIKSYTIMNDGTVQS